MSDNFLNFIDKYLFNDINELLEIRKLEPENTLTRQVLRVGIMGYELGSLQQSIIKNSQENVNDYIKKGYLENGKLGMADLITQCKMLCIDLSWNYREIELLGIEHLKEREKDFKKDGYGIK